MPNCSVVFVALLIGTCIAFIWLSDLAALAFDHTRKNYVRVDVVNSVPVLTLISIVGWIYFAAWTISFWPQIIQNHKRQSVIGLDFNFIVLNFTGFACYSTFNCALFWSKAIQTEYFRYHPYGVNPIQINDIFFSLHALFATGLTAVQCFIYERGAQRVSRVCVLLLVAIYTFIFISTILGATGIISWFAFIEYLSGVKLGVTLIKYVPQLWLNFRRKSTEGWSIGNVLLDFTGGSFSVLQMLLIAYCYDDWGEIFGDFTKFGLGAISLTFDILFVIQHYILYPKDEADLYRMIHQDDGDVNVYVIAETGNPAEVASATDSGVQW